MAMYYDWQELFARQTGTNGERAFIVGGKDIGKTYGLKMALVKKAMREGWQTVEISRTKEQSANLARRYLNKHFSDGLFAGYEWDTKGGAGYLLKRSPEGDVLERHHVADFVPLGSFHDVKQLPFEQPRRYVMDEAAIDRRVIGRGRGYLDDELGLIAELVDSVSREQYDKPLHIRAYFLANAVDISAPIFRGVGIERLPDFGWSWHDHKRTILHRVKPWAVDERLNNTFSGRMLQGRDGAASAIDNVFTEFKGLQLSRLGKGAKFLYGLRLQGHTVGFWVDGGALIASERTGQGRIYALTRADGSIDYPAVESSAQVCRIIRRAYFTGSLEYTSRIAAADTQAILGFLGVA